MQKICKNCSQNFEVTESDIKFYKKMGVPTPTFCLEGRQQRRIAFRNFWNLYHRKCDATGKKIISMYSDSVSFPVYDKNFWWGDNWDPKAFGIDFDFSKTFFENYDIFNKKVPRSSISNTQTENCNFSNLAYLSKNCYLVFGCVKNEDCMYGKIVWSSKNCFDCYYIYRCEWCSNSVDLNDCYDTHFSTECANCVESYFLHDCRNCKNCFGCTNLRNKEFYFFNKKLSREKYFQRLKSIFPLTPKILSDGRIWLKNEKHTKCIFPENFNLKTEECVGNHILESKNVFYGFDVKKSEDCKFLFSTAECQNCYDISFTGGAQKSFNYECLTSANSNDIRFCQIVVDSSNIDYSELCFYSKDLFACNGLRNAQYCILNKQYSKEEYFELREKIIEHMKKTGEWGEFFPVEMSPFAYNETVANEYFPMSKEEVLAKGWKWKDDDKKDYLPQKIKIPDLISEVEDKICDEILACEKCKKNYKIQKSELKFYRKMDLPIPHKCPDCRHTERMKLRNPRKLWDRKCDKCSYEIKTSFAPNRPEKVYCERCYLESVN